MMFEKWKALFDLEGTHDQLVHLPVQANVRFEIRNKRRIKFSPSSEFSSVTRDMGGCFQSNIGGMKRFDSFSGFANAKERIQAFSKSYLKYFPTLVVDNKKEFSGENKDLSVEDKFFATDMNCMFTHFEIMARAIKDFVLSYEIDGSMNSIDELILDSEGSRLAQTRQYYLIKITLILECSGRFQTIQKYFSGKKFKDLDKPEIRLFLDGLRAKPVNRSPLSETKLPIVFSPTTAGYFVHECIGHQLEADYYSQLNFAPGKKVGPDFIEVIDDGTMMSLPSGSYFDHEGVPTQKTTLVKNGIVQKLISTKFFEEMPTGNARAESYRSQICPRMTCTYLNSGKNNPDAIINSIKKGIYIDDLEYGRTIGSSFFLQTSDAKMIRNGSIAEPINNFICGGPVVEMVNKIEAIGNDLKWSLSSGCIKNGQYLPDVTWGGPHLLIREMEIVT